MKPKKMKVADLVLDYTIYPRPSVDSTHVGALAQSLEAGAEFPPVTACAKTKRVVDGFHRIKCYERCNVKDCLVLLKTYASEADLLLDSIRANASHGRRLTPYDKSRCLLLAERFGLDDATIAEVLQVTVERVGELRVGTFGKSRSGAVALKRTIKHMAGRTLTKRQQEANQKLSGMNAVFYVNQLIELIEADLLDPDNERLAERLARLHQLLNALPSCVTA